jgi:hypothetical protein
MVRACDGKSTIDSEEDLNKRNVSVHRFDSCHRNSRGGAYPGNDCKPVIQREIFEHVDSTVSPQYGGHGRQSKEEGVDSYNSRSRPASSIAILKSVCGFRQHTTSECTALPGDKGPKIDFYTSPCLVLFDR